MILKLSLDTFISGLIDYMFITIFCLLGAILKDTYNTLTDKDTTVKISRILISTIVSSIILFAFSDYLAAKLTWKLFILPCFIGGGVGFEVFGKINNIEFWIKMVLCKNKESIVQTMYDEINKDSDAKSRDPTKKE